MQGAPLLELHASIAGVLATYDDGGSQLADAADTHLGLHVGPLKADVDVSHDALHLQVWVMPWPLVLPCMIMYRVQLFSSLVRTLLVVTYARTIWRGFMPLMRL